MNNLNIIGPLRKIKTTNDELKFKRNVFVEYNQEMLMYIPVVLIFLVLSYLYPVMARIAVFGGVSFFLILVLKRGINFFSLFTLFVALGLLLSLIFEPVAPFLIGILSLLFLYALFVMGKKRSNQKQIDDTVNKMKELVNEARM